MFDDKMVAHFSTVKQHFDRQMAVVANFWATEKSCLWKIPSI